MIEFKTEKGKFVVVDMSHNAYFQNTPLPDGYTTEKFIKLTEATEENAKGVVDEDNDYGVTLYQNYATTSMAYYDEQLTALDSLHSLLTSKGIDINNGNWYLFKKI